MGTSLGAVPATDAHDLTPQERAVLALWLLIQVPMSTREICKRCGMEMAGAWKMLNRISRVVPLYRDGASGGS